jgi:hypothetical protein
MQAISRWGIARKVPLGSTTTFAALAAQCGVQEADMRRLLRYAMVHHRLFREPRPGVVAHSLASRLLAEEPLHREPLWLFAEWFAADTAPHAVRALERWGREPTEPNRTAFNVAMGMDTPLFEWMNTAPEGPEYSRRFGLAMTAIGRISSRPTREPSLPGLLEEFPWGELGECTVVDVGGSRGADGTSLARRFPNVSVVVQDRASMMEGAEEEVPPELHGRVRFMPYDFLTPQPLAADVYLIKYCMHNWPDKYCVQILRNQVPALRKGARLVVCDSLVPPPGAMSLMDERSLR